MKRIFLAVRLSAEINKKIADAVALMQTQALSLGYDEDHMTWVEPYNYHVTLKFFGPTSEEEIPGIIRKVKETVLGVLSEKKLESINVKAKGTGVFPNETFPKILWIKIHDETGALQEIADKLEHVFSDVLKRTNPYPFKAHLTLAKIKHARGISQVLVPFKAVDFGDSTVDSIMLYESVPRPNGKGMDYVKIDEMCF